MRRCSRVRQQLTKASSTGRHYVVDTKKRIAFDHCNTLSTLILLLIVFKDHSREPDIRTSEKKPRSRMCASAKRTMTKNLICKLQVRKE